jgi:hypothetical protein
VTEYVVRFLAGGLLVSMFAVVGASSGPRASLARSKQRLPSLSQRWASPGFSMEARMPGFRHIQ